MKRGIIIGDYVLAELLNEGGMGQVWLARRAFEGGGTASVAIKFPHASGVLDVRIRDSLQDEARLQMQFQHPNIPRVIEMGIYEGLPYFVMDYIAGRSLSQLLERLREVGAPLRFEMIAHIMREVAHALSYAHCYVYEGVERQAIHRDVAPKNTLISGQGGVYVIDFGVSEGIGVRSSRNHIKGTLLYMAPEHALGFPSPKSDGFGLGAMAWEMIEGRPFRGEIDPSELRRAANEGRRGELTREGIPEALRFVTEGLLRVDERDRLTLEEALAPLESAEFPPRRSALRDLLRHRFGRSVTRSGQTLHDFQMTEQLGQTIAAAKVVKSTGVPLHRPGWSLEAFNAAGAPSVVPTSGTRPIPRAVALDDDDDDEVAQRPEGSSSGKESYPTTLRTSRAPWEKDSEPPTLVGRTEVLPRIHGSTQKRHERLASTERIPSPVASVEPAPGAVVEPVAQNVSSRPSESSAPPAAEERGSTGVSGGSVELPAARRDSAPGDRGTPAMASGSAESPVAEREPDAPTLFRRPRPGRPRVTTSVHQADASPVNPRRSSTVIASGGSVPPVGTERAPRDPAHGDRRPAKRSRVAILAVLCLASGCLLWLVWLWSMRSDQPLRDTTPGSGAEVASRVSVDAGGAQPSIERAPRSMPVERVSRSSEPAIAVVAGPAAHGQEGTGDGLEHTTGATGTTGATDVEGSDSGAETTQEAPVPVSDEAHAREVEQPARATKPVRVEVELNLGRTDAIEIELRGVRRSLSKDDASATVRVKPGAIQARWREPGAPWSQREIRLDAGQRYEVYVHPWGPLVVARPR